MVELANERDEGAGLGSKARVVAAGERADVELVDDVLLLRPALKRRPREPRRVPDVAHVRLKLSLPGVRVTPCEHVPARHGYLVVVPPPVSNLLNLEPPVPVVAAGHRIPGGFG